VNSVEFAVWRAMSLIHVPCFSGWNTHGETSVAIKKRCMEILGYDEYIESHGDGLQILRYKETTAYIPHVVRSVVWFIVVPCVHVWRLCIFICQDTSHTFEFLVL
jgi:hypothetical protein